MRLVSTGVDTGTPVELVEFTHEGVTYLLHTGPHYPGEDGNWAWIDPEEFAPTYDVKPATYEFPEFDVHFGEISERP